MGSGRTFPGLYLLDDFLHVDGHLDTGTCRIHDDNSPVQAGDNSSGGILKSGLEIFKNDGRPYLRDIDLDISRDL
jgi:hypothetical protein